jgi:hypothetical protein
MGSTGGEEEVQLLRDEIERLLAATLQSDADHLVATAISQRAHDAEMADSEHAHDAPSRRDRPDRLSPKRVNWLDSLVGGGHTSVRVDRAARI